MPASAFARAHIQAVRLVSDAKSTLPIEAEAGPDGAVLDLDDGVWRVQASSPGFWSQEVEVRVGRQEPASVRIALWPAASLHGEILTTEGEAQPSVLAVELSATSLSDSELSAAQASGLRPGLSPSHAELHCQIAGGTWNCLSPAGLFDVRLEASGYAPRYAWGVSLKPAESTDLGRIELRRTPSVFGRAVRKDGSNPPGPCLATLQPDLERRSGPEAEPESALVGEKIFTVPLSRSGYFQVVGVLPGRHLLTVECPTASGFRELRVQGESETRVEPPILLEELTLEVVVAPAADPQGQPWQLTVDATAPRLRRIANQVPASAEGRWIRRGLMAGNYRVVVTSSDGTAWLQQDFDLGTDSKPLLLRVGFVRVAGRVLLGARPVRAALVFSNEAGGEPVTLNSDDEGSFQGLLPIAPDARETTWIVDAHVVQPHTNRRLVGVEVQAVAGGAKAWLELVLPMIAVRGIVVSEDGQPVPNTQVTFEDSTGVQTTSVTDEAGVFELPDLSPGKYTAAADSLEGVSDRVPFDVAEGSERELRLILHPSMHVPFEVVSSQTQEPISEATVQVWTSPGVPRANVRTDRAGRFEVTLPPGTTEVGLTVGAPDYALRLTRMPVSNASDPSENPNTITLDASGGTLVLNFPPAGRTLDRPATLYLVHNGAIADARTVAGWGTDQAGTSGDGPAVVDLIEPGVYVLCQVDPAELPALWLGALPPDRCRKGTLEVGRTLTLSPP
jgi:hypothetical protein